MSPSSESPRSEALIDAAAAAGMSSAEAAKWRECLQEPCGCGPASAASIVAALIGLLSTRGRSFWPRVGIVFTIVAIAATAAKSAGLAAEQRVYDGRLELLRQRIAELDAGKSKD